MTRNRGPKRESRMAEATHDEEVFEAIMDDLRYRVDHGGIYGRKVG